MHMRPVVRRGARTGFFLLGLFVAAGVAVSGRSSVLAVEGEAAAALPPAAASAEGKAEAKGGKKNGAKAEAKDEAKKFGDWALVCPKDEDKDDKAAAKDANKNETKDAAKQAANECRLVQTAILTVPNKEGGEPQTQRVMLTAIGYIGEEKQPVLSVIVPLGVLLQPGLVLEAEGYDQLKLPLQRCDANGCLALLPMKEQLVEAFRKGKEAQITFFNIAGKGNKVRISLSGFSGALDALGKQRKG